MFDAPGSAGDKDVWFAGDQSSELCFVTPASGTKLNKDTRTSRPGIFDSIVSQKGIISAE
ncbi:MAG: hypothetical protein HN757_07670 [Calditrichaeota bacterium]|nr:hypothetical protein [Calditrichota bacterium]